MSEQQAKIVEVIQVTTIDYNEHTRMDLHEYFTKEGRSIGRSPGGVTVSVPTTMIPVSELSDLTSDRQMLEWLVAESAYCVHRGSGVGYAVIKITTGGLRQVGEEYQDWREAIRSAMEATANDV